MYPAVLSQPQAPRIPHDFEFFASTEPRFDFDAFCNIQLLLAHEPVASGVVIWTFGEHQEGSVKVDLLKPFSSNAASGALVVDAGLLFTSALNRLWSTPLTPASQMRWLDVERFYFGKSWLPLSEDVSFAPAQEPATIDSSQNARTPFLLPSAIVQTEAARQVDIATPYSAILCDLIKCGPWSSRKKLGKILGTSHTQVGRILKEDAVPND